MENERDEQIGIFEQLKQLCSGEAEAERYFQLLEACGTAQEIANKVVKPLFATQCIKEEEAQREAFYMALAKVADPGGLRIKRGAMYHNVRRVIKEVKDEKRSNEMHYHVGRYSNGCDFRVLVHPDGFTELTAHLQFRTMDTRLIRLLMPALEYLEASVRTVTEKRLDARGQLDDVPVYDVECRMDDMPILLRYMQTVVGGGLVTYISANVEQRHISLEEALEIAQSEADEIDETES